MVAHLTPEHILESALFVAESEGLSSLTFARVARQAGTSDRMVVYYFATKEALVSAVLEVVANQLRDAIGAAFTAPAADYRDVVQSAWPVLSSESTQPTFRLFFEALGFAAAGRQPYTAVVPALLLEWVGWVSGLLGGTASQRQREAEAAIAVIDGLLLLREIAGPAAAHRAASALGVAGGIGPRARVSRS